ncbi:BF3164 family lipoprotein [Algoriphagus aquatilis]|jgi:hypothetical protein|uniref:BF3164 family lipoprotein n=1 Tax=Algoriphagus aquatilis TaxID=490186 RepID=A0ABW0BWV4_9BACT
MKIQYILLFILFSLVQCTSKTSIDPFDFPNNGKPQYELVGEKIYFPEVLSPWKIDQKEEFLIIQESYKIPSDKPLIHLIKKKSLTLFASKGVIGEGPGQLTDADIFDPGLSDSTFWINAVMSKKMAQFNLYDTSRLSIREFRQPESMLFAYMMYLTKEETFMCLVADTPNKLTEYDFDGKKVGGYGTWEQIPGQPEMDNFLLMTYNKGRLKSNKEKRFYVKASFYRDRIEIFDYQTKTFTNVDGPRKELPPAQISGSGSNSALVFSMDQKYGHKDVAVSERFIYSLYSGRSQQDIQKTGRDSETVFVLSKKGEVISKLMLNKSIRGLTVDESLGKIYGITTDEDPGIAVFDIPKELLKN